MQTGPCRGAVSSLVGYMGGTLAVIKFGTFQQQYLHLLVTILVTFFLEIRLLTKFVA